VKGRLLVKFRPQTSPTQVQQVLQTHQARTESQIPQIGVHLLQLPANASEQAFLNAFRNRPEVEFAELDQIHPLAQISTPNDPLYPYQWQLSRIQAPGAWASTTGNGVTIAIVDTGVDSTHPDLAPHIVPGRNVNDNNSDTRDVQGHGTLVAGTAAAVGNNGLGGASVAWNAWIMPIRASLPDGTAYSSTLANGIIWAADHGARVANVSYMVSTSSTIVSAGDYMRNRGGAVTVAAGNYSTFVTNSDVSSIITVSATDSNDLLYSWSNYGNLIDVSAPGCVEATTFNGGGNGGACGTSVAAPMAAGVAALIISRNPGLSGADVIRILKQSADDLGAAGWDTIYGAGRVNASKAVSLASSGSTDSQLPTISITWPASGSTVSGTVTIQVTANDNTGVTSVTYTLNGSTLGTVNTSPFIYNWNTTTRANGGYTLTATARDAAGNQASASIPVIINNTADTTAPTVSIVSPVSGALVNGNLTVTVNAYDNVAVVKTELYVDGALKATATAAPFAMRWNSRKDQGTRTLVVKAYDARSNVGTSAPVTITVR
jgi:subtilisin family serine protease